MGKTAKSILMALGIIAACVVAVAGFYYFLIYPEQYGNVSDYERVIGKADSYTDQEINAAMDVVEETFTTWGGCKMISLRYDEELIPQTELEERKEKNSSQKVIILFSDFSTSKNVDGGFNQDFTYTNFHWVLVCEEDQAWILESYGYT